MATNLVPVLLRNGQRAMVPRDDREAAMADPLAAPVTDIIPRRASQRLRPVLLQSGQVAQVPAEDYGAALGDPLAHGEQGQATTTIPLANGRSARVPERDVGAALRDPLALQDSPPLAADDMEDAALANMASPAPVPDSPEAVDALGSAFDESYAPGLARQQAALEAATAPTPRAPSARPPPRRPVYDVERVPSTVPLASRLGGEPQPGPRRGASPEQETPQQGPTFGEGDTLEDAQKRERLLRGVAGMARGTSRIGAAIAGTRPEEGAAADLDTSAGSQVRDYLMRRQQGEADRASAEQAALRDPTSPASQRFQAMVSRAFGSVYSPEQIQGMTAADAPLVSKYGEMVRTLEDRAAGRADTAAQRAADRESREQIAADNRAARAEDSRQRGADRALQRELVGAQRAATAEAMRGERQEKEVTRHQADLAQELDKTGINGFYPRYREAAEILTRYKDLPGVGQIAGHFPDFMTSADGIALRQSVGQMLAEYRKGVTGAGMSDSERAEYAKITGLTSTADEKAFRQGLERLRGAMDERARALSAGKPQEAVNRLSERNPTVRDILSSAQRTGMQGNMDLEATPGERHQYSKSRNRTRVVDAQGNVIREYEGRPNA